MSEFKGTKGKWTIYKATMINIKDPISHSIYVGTKRIALCYNLFEQDKSKNVEEKISEANAKLIACAPEMLEMLIHCEKVFRQGGGMEYTLSDIQSLIKKATE